MLFVSKNNVCTKFINYFYDNLATNWIFPKCLQPFSKTKKWRFDEFPTIILWIKNKFGKGV